MEIEYVKIENGKPILFRTRTNYGLLAKRMFRIQNTKFVFILLQDHRKIRNKRIGFYFTKKSGFVVTILPKDIEVKVCWKQKVKSNFIEMIYKNVIS